mmetsp:Transcript_4515/g.19183  ORF Transcript_4515/g.19183 Transcript_4515/m.19183 type:complete len:253 (-) Transcript_4515:3419-4177(-)
MQGRRRRRRGRGGQPRRSAGRASPAARAAMDLQPRGGSGPGDRPLRRGHRGRAPCHQPSRPPRVGGELGPAGQGRWAVARGSHRRHQERRCCGVACRCGWGRRARCWHARPNAGCGRGSRASLLAHHRRPRRSRRGPAGPPGPVRSGGEVPRQRPPQRRRRRCWGRCALRHGSGRQPCEPQGLGRHRGWGRTGQVVALRQRRGARRRRARRRSLGGARSGGMAGRRRPLGRRGPRPRHGIAGLHRSAGRRVR